MTRRMLVLLALALAAAGMATVAASGDAGPTPGVVSGWDGVAAPDGRVRYVAFAAGRQTIVAAVRRRGGRVVRFNVVPGSFGIPLVAYDGSTAGISADGRTLVLAEGGNGRQPVSRFLILNARTLGWRLRVVLAGAFSFDALSPDCATLYLTEYVGGNTPSGYRVRAYDVPARRLLPLVITDRRTTPASMSGYPVTRVSRHDGTWAYTLFSKGGGKPFVHALDTRRREAVCIDLPWRGSQNGLDRIRLRFGDRGRALLLVRRSSGAVVARIDTTTFRVERG